MIFDISIDTGDLIYECVEVEQRNEMETFKKGEFYSYTDIINALREHNYEMTDTDTRESDRQSVVMGANAKRKFSLVSTIDLEIALAHPTEAHNLYGFNLVIDDIKETINNIVAFDCLKKEM